MTKITLMTALLAGTTLTGAAKAQSQTFNLAFTPPSDSHYGDAGRAFQDRIEELSDGEIAIELRPSGALGGEREVLEGLQIGTVPLTISSTGPIGNFVPEVYALDFPFLFDSYESARSILDGEIGQELLESFQDAGLVGLAWAENGFRHTTNSMRPIETPEDFAGLKLRTMENEVHISAFEALGAAPTPMNWTEVLTSLQQGTIDGQENPVPIITANNMWEMQQYVTMTGHAYSAAAVLMSEIYWTQLSDEEQGWFREAAQAAADASRSAVDQMEAEGIASMKENGMEVIEEIDTAAFAEAVQPAYEEYAEQYAPELIERIRAAQQ